MTPVAPIREAFEAGGGSAVALAHTLGWYGTRTGRTPSERANAKADSSRVRRALGIIPDRKGGPCRQQITLSTAYRLVDAMGLDPVDVGL